MSVCDFWGFFFGFFLGGGGDGRWRGVLMGVFCRGFGP